jgi:hypothetical protein
MRRCLGLVLRVSGMGRCLLRLAAAEERDCEDRCIQEHGVMFRALMECPKGLTFTRLGSEYRLASGAGQKKVPLCGAVRGVEGKEEDCGSQGDDTSASPDEA